MKTAKEIRQQFWDITKTIFLAGKKAPPEGENLLKFMSENKDWKEFDKLLTELPSLPEELKRAADEREVFVQAFDKITKEFEGRHWLMEGRGTYPYNDERYKEEVRYIMDAFKAIKEDVWRQVKSGTHQYKGRIIKEYITSTSYVSEIGGGWDTKSTLLKLIWASEYLLNEKNYDGHNYEAIEICVKRGKEIIELFSLEGWVRANYSDIDFHMQSPEDRKILESRYNEYKTLLQHDSK